MADSMACDRLVVTFMRRIYVHVDAHVKSRLEDGIAPSAENSQGQFVQRKASV